MSREVVAIHRYSSGNTYLPDVFGIFCNTTDQMFPEIFDSRDKAEDFLYLIGERY